MNHPALPFPLPDDASRYRVDGDVVVTRLAGEQVELMAARALHWPRERTVFVADVHLGKGASFRAGGIPLPRGPTATDLGRLSALVQRTRAERLVVLGDFLHDPRGRVPALDRAFRTWRDAHGALAVTLVRGNHDRRSGDPDAAWGMDVVPEPFGAPPFVLCHSPCDPPTGYALCGHVHPGVRLESPNGADSARLPCFVVGRRCAILPAFGRLTGLALVAPSPGQRIVVIAGTRVFLLPA